VSLTREQCPALSGPILALLGELYEIEDRGRLLNDAQRLVLRQQESVPVMARLWAVLDSPAARQVLPKSKFGEALNYLRNHWAAFQVYLRDVLEQLARGTADLRSLLPDVWKAAHPDRVRTFRVDEKEQRAQTRRYLRARRRLQQREAASQA